MFLTPATLTAEDEVTKNRNVVVEGDHCAARRTARIRKDDRLFARHAMNDDVKKAADDCAKNAG